MFFEVRFALYRRQFILVSEMTLYQISNLLVNRIN